MLNTIETAIEQAVGAKLAVGLLAAKLSSTFTNRIESLRSRSFPPGDDTEIVAKVRDGAQEITVAITIFKRSSSRVFLFPVMASKAVE